MTAQHESGLTHQVVVNDEDQHSVWWLDREMPEGWWAEGTRGSRDECLAYIGRVWRDITPLSVRRRLAEESS